MIKKLQTKSLSKLKFNLYISQKKNKHIKLQLVNVYSQLNLFFSF